MNNNNKYVRRLAETIGAAFPDCPVIGAKSAVFRPKWRRASGTGPLSGMPGRSLEARRNLPYRRTFRQNSARYVHIFAGQKRAALLLSWWRGRAQTRPLSVDFSNSCGHDFRRFFPARPPARGRVWDLNWLISTRLDGFVRHCVAILLPFLRQRRTTDARGRSTAGRTDPRINISEIAEIIFADEMPKAARTSQRLFSPFPRMSAAHGPCKNTLEVWSSVPFSRTRHQIPTTSPLTLFWKSHQSKRFQDQLELLERFTRFFS